MFSLRTTKRTPTTSWLY